MVTLKTALPVIFGPIFWRKLIAYLTLFVIGYSLSDFLDTLFRHLPFCLYFFLSSGPISLKKYTIGESTEKKIVLIKSQESMQRQISS